MTVYNYTEEVDDVTLLTLNINNAGLTSSILQSITTVGSGPTMSVALSFAGDLSVSDQTTLNNVMSSYTNIATATMNHMISTITTAVQTQSNLITLLTAKVTMSIPGLSYEQLLQIMTLLNLS